MSATEQPSPPAEAGSAPTKKKSARERFGAKLNPFGAKSTHCVTRSADFRRIAALPRREQWIDYAEALTLALAKPPVKPGTCPSNCPCKGTGRMTLRPRQAWALSEIFEQRGGVCILGPGDGKTLITLLLPTLMGWERAVLFVPAALKHKTVKIDHPLLSRHWKLPPLEGLNNLEVQSYEKLSRDYEQYLEKRRVPDGIMCDEVHNLKNRGSGRSKKLMRFFQNFPHTDFVALSGSLVHRSVMDYGHITLFALKDAAPLPHSFIELKTWSDALDEGLPDYARPDAGALLDFCKEGETTREGYRRRLLETAGIISNPELSTNIGLNVLEAAMPDIPRNVIEAFHRLRNFGELPPAPGETFGEKCSTALDQLRHARELLLGFYLRWVWPNGKRDVEWLDKRRRWRSYVRQMTTRSHGGRYYDTEAQVALAVKRGELDGIWYDEKEKPWHAYTDWVAVREDRKKLWGNNEPPKEVVWLSDYMLVELERWAAENTGIVWIENIGFMEKLRERGNICYGAGENEIEGETGERSVFASYAHTVGKNLQMFHKMCFSNPLQSGKAWEQALGREHRPGQKADDVEAHVYLGCRETWWSFERSRLDASYIEATLGQPQRLNKATIACTTTEEVALTRCDAGDPLWALSGYAMIDGPLGRGRGLEGAASNTPILTALKEEAKDLRKQEKERNRND